MRFPIFTVAVLAFAVGAPGIADAAKRKVAVPNKYDGNWSIEVVTMDGPCDRAYRYGIQVYQGQAIYPGGDVRINGRVSNAGTVNAVIARGNDNAQVVGRLGTVGTGAGTWQTIGGGPISCSGRWNAIRRS